MEGRYVLTDCQGEVSEHVPSLGLGWRPHVPDAIHQKGSEAPMYRFNAIGLALLLTAYGAIGAQEFRKTKPAEDATS